MREKLTWLRNGDASEYESHEDIVDAALSLRDLLLSWDKKPVREDISFVGKGVRVKGVFAGNNYVSLFNAGPDMEDPTELSKAAKEDFVRWLVKGQG